MRSESSLLLLRGRLERRAEDIVPRDEALGDACERPEGGDGLLDRRVVGRRLELGERARLRLGAVAQPQDGT